MKQLFSIFVLLFSLNANADIIASYEFGYASADPMLVGGNQGEVVLAELDDQGVLAVSVKPVGSKAHPLAIFEPVASKKLHKENFRQMFWMVTSLSKAPIKNYQIGAVCEIFVAPHMFHNHLSVARDYVFLNGQKLFLNPLRVVHGPSGCWVGNKIYLETEQANETAVQLKAMIRVLALELMN